jgi:hypothetical protein
VLRFGEHFCAADFYKRGKCRGNCVQIVLDFSFGAVGFLVNGAQRAGATLEIRTLLFYERGGGKDCFMKTRL